MPDRRQVPRTAQLLGPALAAIVAARPGTLPFLNLGAGRYADITAGWEAQCALLVRQIAREVAAARLKSATGDELSQLTASEFETVRESDKVNATGLVRIARSGSKPGGVIPAGHRFRRNAATLYTPPIPASAYVATRDVSVAQGSSVCIVPIAASLAGSAGNAPIYDGDNSGGGEAALQFGDPPFDPAFAIGGYLAAGGSDGQGDGDLRAQALAYASGRYGPTLGAIVAGALSGIGVHRAAVFDVAQAVDPITGLVLPCAYTGVAIADASWASSGPFVGPGLWEGLVGQVIADSFQGMGGQVLVTGVTNTRIRVDASVLLRDGDDLKNTSEIDAALLQAATSYFDDRPDWYTWTEKGLRAWLSRAHPKILSCPSVTVRALTTNAALDAPASAPPVTTSGLQATHWALAQNGLTPAYTAAT